MEPHALKVNGVSFNCRKSLWELRLQAIPTRRPSMFRTVFSDPPATGKDRRRRQAELRPGIPFNPFKASECVHSLVFCGARAETMWGLWLLRGRYSSFTQSAQAAALSSCPTLSLSQPDRPEGRSRMLFQLAKRRPEDQYVACWSRVREKTTDGLGMMIVPKFQTKSSGYFHCLGKFYTVYVRYLCFFTL